MFLFSIIRKKEVKIIKSSLPLFFTYIYFDKGQFLHITSTMHIIGVTFVVLFLSGYVLSADNQIQSEGNEPAISLGASFVKKNPLLQ